ncbi:Gaa1-like protein [Melampsora americana]|nr:Gaa1-like protein [Melampsora americana]
MSIYSKLVNRFQQTNTSNQKEDGDDDEDNHEEEEEEEEEEEIDPELKSLITRVLRRRRMVKFISSATPIISSLLIIAGLISALILPTHLLSRGTYISENAIQPGQVNTYWGWSQVHKADKYADRVDLWRTLPSNERAEEMRLAFESMGLPSQTQTYSFTHPHASTSIANGTNVHATLHAPRTDGAETLVLMASWLTRKPGSDVKGGDVNVRGVASVLALADYLITMNLWSKDIIFLIADGYLHGTQAWLQAYHDLPQSSLVFITNARYLQTERLKGRSGPIWAALSIDYPFHSFSHVGIYYEGINGQLPNLDFINTASNIIRWTGSCPVTIHDGSDGSSASHSRSTFMNDYILSSQTILRQIKYGLLGEPSGPEGLFTPYRIDAIGLFAVPAEGPHGFHTIGRIVESTMRSLNNLLERFHQSFFLYLMMSEKRFISVGNYLFVPVLIGVGITLLAFSLWGALGSEDEGKGKQREESEEKKRIDQEKEERMRGYGDQEEGSLVWCFKIITGSHLIGAGCFWRLLRSIEPTKVYESPKMWLIGAIWISLPIAIVGLDGKSTRSVKRLEAILLLLVGCLISVVSVLNFALGVGLGILFGPSLGLFPIIFGRSSKIGRGLSLIWLMIFGFSWIGWIELKSLMINDQCLGSWLLGFWLVIGLPLVMNGCVIGLSYLIR